MKYILTAVKSTDAENQTAVPAVTATDTLNFGTMFSASSITNIPEQDDEFNDIRSEYSEMLQHQLTKGNNGLIKRK